MQQAPSSHAPSTQPPATCFCCNSSTGLQLLLWILIHVSSFPAGLMRSADTVLTAKTNQTLQDIIPMLNKVSGLPVVDANDRVIGVISRKVSPATDSSCSCCNTLLHARLLPGRHPSSRQQCNSRVRLQLAVAAMHQAELRSDTCPARLACVPLLPAAGHHPRAPC